LFEEPNRPTVEADDKTRFFVIGDFGTLAGYYGLRKASLIMESLAAKQNYSHIITAGDNFYIMGIPNINFRLHPWLVTSVYRRDYIGQLKIYPTLGNHDCHSDYRNEILYSQYNDQWEMESDYYELSTPLNDGSGKNFVNLMLNTCKLLCAEGNRTGQHYCESLHTEIGSPPVVEHYEWLEAKLKEHSTKNTTAWLAVTIHHPPFTNGSLKQYFLPLVRKYKVDFMFVGHEHWAEYSNMDPSDVIKLEGDTGDVINDCPKGTDEILIKEEREHTFKKGEKLHQFVGGNSGTFLRHICPLKQQDGDLYFKNKQYNGIMSVEATSKEATINFHKTRDDIVYQIHVTNE